MVASDPTGIQLAATTIALALERARRQERERLCHHLLEASSDSVVITDREGSIKLVNSNALSLFGRRREDLDGERLPILEPAGRSVERNFTTPEGERVGEMRVVECEWDGERSVLASIRDVTERKRFEMQLMMSDRLAALGSLSAGLAHEINNPLGAVLGNIELAFAEMDGAKSNADAMKALRNCLSDAREASERIRQIVRDLRVFSRTEEDTRGTFDIHQILDPVVRMVWNEVRHRARLIKDYGQVSLVEVNQSRLSQVFLNLIVNAAHAIPEGRASENEIRVTTRVTAEGWVAVDVTDTGCGIAPDAQKRIFTPFFTTKPPGAGTGLGLAISHQIVRSLGGRIAFESTVGRGSRFTVEIPQAFQPQSTRASSADSTGATPPARRGRVLVIDDEAVLLQLIDRILGSEHDVTRADRGRSAVELISRGDRFDVILCDLMMPEMTGIDVYDAVKAISVSQAERMVFMTGGAFTPRSRAFLDQVSNQRIEKPFATRGLRSIVRAVLDDSPRTDGREGPSA